MDVPFGVPESFDEHIKLQFDLQALAFQGDITRVSVADGRPRRQPALVSRVRREDGEPSVRRTTAKTRSGVRTGRRSTAIT